MTSQTLLTMSKCESSSSLRSTVLMSPAAVSETLPNHRLASWVCQVRLLMWAYRDSSCLHSTVCARLAQPYQVLTQAGWILFLQQQRAHLARGSLMVASSCMWLALDCSCRPAALHACRCSSKPVQTHKMANGCFASASVIFGARESKRLMSISSRPG